LFTVLTDRAADIATAHVAVGSLTLAVGCWFSWAVRTHRGSAVAPAPSFLDSGLPETAAVR